MLRFIYDYMIYRLYNTIYIWYKATQYLLVYACYHTMLILFAGLPSVQKQHIQESISNGRCSSILGSKCAIVDKHSVIKSTLLELKCVLLMFASNYKGKFVI